AGAGADFRLASALPDGLERSQALRIAIAQKAALLPARLLVAEQDERALFDHLEGLGYGEAEVVTAFEEWVVSARRARETHLRREVEGLLPSRQSVQTQGGLVKLNQYRNALRFCNQAFYGDKDEAKAWLTRMLAARGLRDEESVLQDAKESIPGFVASECPDRTYTEKQIGAIVGKLGGLGLNPGRVEGLVRQHLEENGYREKRGVFSLFFRR
ncbi:MAG: hypothetical protein ABIO70_07920, partial [Pseudomonadota bacterium]